MKNQPGNSILYDFVPKNDYDQLLMICDVGIILLDVRFTIPNFPSRLLAYMENRIPILAATDVNTDLGEIIEKNMFGLWAEAGDLETFNKNLAFFYQKSHESKEMGHRAMVYLLENYTSTIT